MKGKLSTKNLKDIATAEKTVEDGDLYAALHRVGDDTVKSEIEWALKQVLDPKAYKTVVAVFKVAIAP